MKSFREKISEEIIFIIEEASGYKIKNSKSVDSNVDAILKLIDEEIIGERKSVAELEEFFGSIHDLGGKVCYKEGYNQKIKEQRKKLSD